MTTHPRGWAMDALEAWVSSTALAGGAAWASGINLYGTIAMLGLGHTFGFVTLPPEMQWLAGPGILVAACILYGIEFIVDKVPGADSVWDAIHTFIRIPAAGMIAGAATGDAGWLMEAAAALGGGGLAAVAHATKAGGRAAINTSPEPFSNWTASVTEDVVVFGGLWAALHNPWLFLGLLAVFLLFAAWLLPRVWRLLASIFGFIGRLFGGGRTAPEAVPPGTEPSSGPAPGMGPH